MIAAPVSVPRRIAISGPMVGRNPGYITTQGEFLTDLLREAGHDVVSVSAHVGRARRLMDTLATLRREVPSAEALIVETYSGPSFIVEDLASWIGRDAGVPVILHLHGGLMPLFARQWPRWAARVLRRAAAIVTPSTYLAREMRPFASNVRVIPNVIELDEYPTRVRERVAPRLLWMRAFHQVYNPLMAIRVLVRVRETLPDATLMMAGPAKGMEHAVADAARAAGVGDAVEFCGFLDHRGKREAAARCDIFLNTTHVDNAPVAVVEMCAMGLPVVSTNVGGIVDQLTHGENALLVPDDDPDAMSEAVVQLVREPTVASRLSRAGAAVAARCAWSAVRPQWESLFAEVTAHGRSAS